jgi:nitroreductase
MEAGHCCQNILLQAQALGLGAVPIGAFDDSCIQKLLNLPEDYVPLYIVPVGYKAE